MFFSLLLLFFKTVKEFLIENLNRFSAINAGPIFRLWKHSLKLEEGQLLLPIGSVGYLSIEEFVKAVEIRDIPLAIGPPIFARFNIKPRECKLSSI